MDTSFSSEVAVTLISDVTDQEAVSENVDSYYVKTTSPYDRTTEKCLFCDKSWAKIVTTTKKGHLSNKELANDYSTTLCPRVPKHVSTHQSETEKSRAINSPRNYGKSIEL